MARIVLVTNHSQNHTWGYTPDGAGSFVTKRFWFCDRVGAEFSVSDEGMALRAGEDRFPCGCDKAPYVEQPETVVAPAKGEA